VSGTDGAARRQSGGRFPEARASIKPGAVQPQRLRSKAERRVVVGEESDVRLDPKAVAVGPDEEPARSLGYLPVTMTATAPQSTVTAPASARAKMATYCGMARNHL